MTDDALRSEAERSEAEKTEAVYDALEPKALQMEDLFDRFHGNMAFSRCHEGCRAVLRTGLYEQHLAGAAAERERVLADVEQRIDAAFQEGARQAMHGDGSLRLLVALDETNKRIAEAVAKEREACAQWIEGAVATDAGMLILTQGFIAAAIRARGKA